MIRALLNLGGTNTLQSYISQLKYPLFQYIANPDIKDNSEMIAMDYALQKGLHYCALLLSQSEGYDDPDRYFNTRTSTQANHI